MKPYTVMWWFTVGFLFGATFGAIATWIGIIVLNWVVV